MTSDQDFIRKRLEQKAPVVHLPRRPDIGFKSQKSQTDALLKHLKSLERRGLASGELAVITQSGLKRGLSIADAKRPAPPFKPTIGITQRTPTKVAPQAFPLRTRTPGKPPSHSLKPGPTSIKPAVNASPRPPAKGTPLSRTIKPNIPIKKSVAQGPKPVQVKPNIPTKQPQRQGATPSQPRPNIPVKQGPKAPAIPSQSKPPMPAPVPPRPPVQRPPGPPPAAPRR